MMTTEEQRIAIAEKCGWKKVEMYEWTGTEYTQIKTPKQWVDFDVLPNYTEDLNAMHEAEKVLSNKEVHEYINIIHNRLPLVDETLTKVLAVFATASKRSEAFCRVFWPERWP